MNTEPVRRILDDLGIRYALIGAHAMAARGYPRATIDVDFLTGDDRVLDPGVWAGLEQEGAAVDARRGDADDPLAGVVHVLLGDGTDVDVVVARWTWEAQVIERAEVLAIAGARVRVPRTSDLILLKLAAGGYLDMRDAAALLALGDRDALVDAVNAHIGEVYPDVRARWRELLAGIDA
ncbi:MAG TPA: hypothetical protein VFV75_19695 [Candidatus Polarisedimenticolaceae bacterium]|nr:hypothetical protein [Candidatus Polarisedimenticolaceae bacterium]